LVTAALAAVAVVIVDQVTKLAIVARFHRGDEVDVIGHVLRVGHARNSGAVFGILRGSGDYFAVFSFIAAAVVVVIMYITRKGPASLRAGLGFVLGGAVGNLIDRLRYGAVVDFIDIGVTDTVRWPSFNVADLAIVTGVAMLILITLKPARQAPSGDAQDPAV
jgi:signal peptidase II